MSFTCPLCHQPLTQINNSVICPQRHQFDVAKEGYINLLPVQHKRSRDPGDSAEMMQARRAFLVAKTAIKAAAKRYSQVKFCVASSHRLPFADASMDAVIRIYAPCKAQELARVVKPGGWVVTATPGPHHLMELKGLIYDEVRLHAPYTEQLDGFTLQQSTRLAYHMPPGCQRRT